MGTDITFFAERKTASGQWELVDSLIRSPEFMYDFPQEQIPYELDLPRNYYLFAMLANVRNGVRTEEKFIPISRPRGVPEDISEIGRSYYDWYGEDAHDASWLTKSEILNFDSSEIIQHQAMVEPSVAHLFKENPLGFPFDGWPECVPISYAAGLTGGVNVRWRSTYEEDGLGYFKTLIKDYRVDDRFVFWFSS